MEIEDNYLLQTRGFFKITIKDKYTNKLIKEIIGQNIVTYIGADILAKSITGESSYKVGYIYGEHADPVISGYVEGSLNGLTASKSDTINTLRTAPRSTTDAEASMLYNNFRSSDSNYNNNIVTFTATFNNNNLVGEIFVGAGLITKIGTSDLLFSHCYYPGHIMQANHNIIIIWDVQFN